MRYLIAFALLTGLTPKMSPGRKVSRAGEDLMDRKVGSFQVKAVSLTDALLVFAQQEKIPMGIEYVDEAGLTNPISVSTGPTTISGALRLIFGHAHGYSYSAQYGTLIISHSGLPPRKRNLLDYTLPSFDAPRTALDKISWELEVALAHQLRPRVRGWAGDYIPSQPAVLVGPIHERKASVKQVLCAIVSQGTPAAWVITVPSERLDSENPRDLWKILPYTAPPTHYAPLLLAALQKSSQPRP